ncbi:hypothetical protein [uncultured Deinococcus sp.]|uniref:hypothetical protein n=1 Tax=uncultured Deinococcus sp. TaxID=158789 RepID=UPI0025F35634|nr:hypothetical protein [uncultured Deinococcus sp.]
MTASTPPTELRTLGDLHLGAFRKVKSLLMLAYVALEGPTPRRDMRTLLWPRARQPESSLRVALYVMREAAPGALEGEDRLETAVSCDATRLLTLRGQEALDAYPGAFLAGVKVGDVSPDFEDWAEDWRSRLARHVQSEAATLAEASDPAHAAALAERAYRMPGAPPAEPELLRRLLAVTLPGSALEAELRAELHALTGPDDEPAPAPVRAATRSGRMLGRSEPLDALLAWAARPGGAVAAVSGPGGIGKSTLSRELLRELTRTGRNAVLVDAEGTRSSADLLPRLAAARAPGQAVQGTWAGLAPLLGDAPVILLDGLDDLDDLTLLLGTLRRELPGVRWVLTGRRRRLGQLARPGQPDLGDLLTLTLSGLDVPPPDADLPEIAASSAVALFLREAARVRREFTLTPGNAGVIGGLTRRLLGHPLALALAASWLRVESLDDVYARVLTEAATLSSPGGDHDGRRGLMLVAQRSWELLSPGEQDAALRLGVCADFDPADAPALGVTDTDLDGLLTHSFLETYQPGSERLRVYPALTGVLTAQAQAHPELAHAARTAHARHYLTWFTAQAPESPPVDAERGNLRLAVSSAIRDGTLKASTVDHLLAHYDRRGLLGSGTDVFAVLADEAEDAGAPDDIQAATQIACMWLAYRSGRLLDAQTLAARFLQGPLANDPASRMKALNTLGSVRGQQGQYKAAVELLQQALTIAEHLGDRVRVIMYRTNILSHLGFSDDIERVRQEMAAIESQLSEFSDVFSTSVRRLLIQTAMHLPDADLDVLSSEVSRILKKFEGTGDLNNFLICLTYESYIKMNQGKIREAQAINLRLENMLKSVEDPEIEIDLALLETKLLYARGRASEARLHAKRMLKLIFGSSNPWDTVELFMITAIDIHSEDPVNVKAFAASIAHNQNTHFSHRWRAKALAGEYTAQPNLLDIDALRAWLEHRLNSL